MILALASPRVLSEIHSGYPPKRHPHVQICSLPAPKKEDGDRQTA